MEFTVRDFLAWILIIIGLFIVFWDITSSYYYFSAQKEFPKVFLNNQISNTTNSVPTGNLIQDQIGTIVKDQIKQLIPENTVTQLLNMTSWIMFASFLLWAGGKVVGLGNDFLKKRQE
jgi:hypothetical protein